MSYFPSSVRPSSRRDGCERRRLSRRLWRRPGRVGPALHLRRLPGDRGLAGATGLARRGSGPRRHLPARGSWSSSTPLPFWDSFRKRTGAQAMMRGVNAAVVGVLGPRSTIRCGQRPSIRHGTSALRLSASSCWSSGAPIRSSSSPSAPPQERPWRSSEPQGLDTSTFSRLVEAIFSGVAEATHVAGSARSETNGHPLSTGASARQHARHDAISIVQQVNKSGGYVYADQNQSKPFSSLVQTVDRFAGCRIVRESIGNGNK